MFAAARVGGMSLKTTPADLGKSVNIGEIEMSHMLHFSSWETFLCSSWLCALQAAILQDTQKKAQNRQEVPGRGETACDRVKNLTCSPSHRCTPSSSSCSPGPTAYCESFCVFSSESALRTDGEKEKSVTRGMAGVTGAVTGGGLPLWGAAGWVESPPLLLTASSHLHWESAPVRTVGRSAAPAKGICGVNTNV